MSSFSSFALIFKTLGVGGKSKRAVIGALFLVSGVAAALIVVAPQISRAGVPILSGGGPQNLQDFVPVEAMIDITASEALSSMPAPSADNVSLRACSGATDATTCASPGATNLCTSVDITNSSTRIVCNHAALSPNTTYRFFIVGDGPLPLGGSDPEVGRLSVRSATNHILAAHLVRIFRTSGVNFAANTTPPRVQSTSPGPGMEFPAGGNMVINFPQGPEGNMNFGTGSGGAAQAGDMNFCQNNLCAVSLKKLDATTHMPGTEICTSTTACALSWNAVGRELTINPQANLDVATPVAAEYDLCIRGTGNTLAVKNSANQSLSADYCTHFRTAAADNTAPALMASGATVPANGATGVSPFTQEIGIRFTENLDPSTISLSTLRFCQDSTSGTPGCEVGDTRLTDVSKFSIRYDTIDRAVEIDPITGDALAANTKYCFEVVGGASGVKDVSSNQFTATSSTNCFTTGAAADIISGGPQVSFVDADNFKIVVRFSESMRPADLITAGNVNTSNVALECPTGVAINLASKPATYRSEQNELEVQGLGLPQDQTCRVTVTTARDLAGNAMNTTNSANVGNFKVLNSAMTGGFLGGGAPASNDFFGGMGGATAASFWEKPTRAEPRNRSTNKGTSMEVEFPAPGAMPVGSTVTVYFPSGFTLSTSDGDTRLVPAAQSFMNGDMNGPESGTLTATASTDTATKTVTLTTAGTTVANGAMMRFELDRLTTPTTPATGLRVTVVVKDNSGVKLGQTINAAPFDIQQAGAFSISGTVCKGTTVGGTCGGADTKIANVKVFCMQMGGFVVGAAGAAAMMGFQEATTDANGAWTISGLTAGEYNCNIPPDPTRLADVGGSPPFQPISITNASRTGVDTKYKDLSVGGGATDVKTLTVNISGGPASGTVDVFCHAGSSNFEFSAPTMKAVDLNASGAATATLRLQQSNTYDCGMGPHMAFESFQGGGPPPVPTFNFMPPKSQKVVMDADKTITFAVQSTNRTIAGTVVDGSAAGIANVFVHAEPVGCFDATNGDFKDCYGAFAQTKSDGTFTLSVADGTYEVGADGPGLPPSTREIANVVGLNVSGLTLKMVKSSTTISGAIQDESGNGIQYAHVYAEKRTITTGSDACNFGNSRPSGGFADSPTDSSGNFTLYVSNGTWCIRAFAPSYGEVGTKTVTMSGTSLTGQNIAATSTDFGTISGTVTKADANVSGAFVNCFGSSGGNHGQTSANGTYSMKVKAGTYTCDGFAPGIGPLGRTANVTVTSNNTTTQNFTIAGNPGTITVTATGLTEGFCDARDSTGGLGSGAPIENGTVTIKAPAGTYTLRCGTRKTGPLTLSTSSVILTAGSTSAITATVPTLRTVTGRITDGTNNLPGATATFTDTTTKSSFTIVTGNQGGDTNLSGTNIPEGTYNVKVAKKGYEAATTTASVSGGNLTMTSAVALTPTTTTSGETVTIPVQESGTAYTGEATVIATKDGKTIVGEIDSTTGNASLDLTNGTWTVKAVGDNGKESSTSTVTIADGAVSGSTPTLSLATSISGYTQKSEIGTLPLSTGGLMKFNDLAVGGTAPEINVPANALSTTDSSTGKMEMKTDVEVASIDPGTDQNFVGSHGYDITPKDANGNKISDTGAITITIPYTDAAVSSAGVDESKLTISSFNTSSQSWESESTTVDTVNNLLIASVTHFSSFGVLGGVRTTNVGSSTTDLTAPVAPTNVRLTSDGSKVTLTWTDPTESDFYRVEILRNEGNGGEVTGDLRAIVAKGDQRYVDTSVQAGKTYKYILKVRDTSLNQRLSDEYTIAVTAAASVSTPSAAAPVTVPAPSTTTTTPPAATPATPAQPTVTPATPATPSARSTPSVSGVSETLRTGTHAYGAARVRMLTTEQTLARTLSKDLNVVLPGVFNRLFHQKTSKSKVWWYTYVNAYTYGGYTLEEIKQAVRFGGKTVHPVIPAAVWRGSGDYQKYMAE